MTDDAVLSDGVLVDDADVASGDNKGADTGEENAEEVAVPAEDAPIEDDPWTRPGSWYVVHTQSGYEKKVTANLHARIQS
ncbi:MAG: transcription termination/antitermination protein NusG, partial [Actinomycetota bacterium]|nr:transcription termination/antitermination protein NusG [Actinomycetota bacterium]